MVGTLHYVHIMLDDNDGMAAAYQCIKGFQQFADVVEVQAGGRLIQNIDGAARGAAASSVASLTRWASPPDRVVEGWPSFT